MFSIVWVISIFWCLFTVFQSIFYALQRFNLSVKFHGKQLSVSMFLPWWRLSGDSRYLLFLISPVPGSMFPILGSRFLVPGSQFLGSLFPVTGSWFLVLGSWFLVSCSRFMFLSSMCLWVLIPDSRFPVIGSWFLVPDSCFRFPVPDDRCPGS